MHSRGKSAVICRAGERGGTLTHSAPERGGCRGLADGGRSDRADDRETQSLTAGLDFVLWLGCAGPAGGYDEPIDAARDYVARTSQQFSSYLDASACQELDVNY